MFQLSHRMIFTLDGPACVLIVECSSGIVSFSFSSNNILGSSACNTSLAYTDLDLGVDVRNYVVSV